MKPEDKISVLKGIGPQTERLFHKIGVDSLEELLHYYPRDYENYRKPGSIGEVQEGKICAVYGTLLKDASVKRFKNMQIVSAQIRDATGTLYLSWFNMPYLRNTLRGGMTYIFRGKVTRGRYGLSMDQPIVYTLDHYEELMGHLSPVYSLTKGMTNRMISGAVSQVLGEEWVRKEYLPVSLRARYCLSEYNYAIRTIHFPPDEKELSVARRRLVFDEFLFFILAVHKMKERTEKAENHFRITPGSYSERILAGLPYSLTGAQKRTLEEIRRDLNGPALMNRLIQGDVGSGKTIIAVLCMLDAVEAGYQAALMAPTEVLARQHFEAFEELLSMSGIQKTAVLLTGSMTTREKRQAYEKIASHKADLIIGTHALIQEKVEYDSLALVITDEQHRFGVRQRESFSAKGKEPHVLVMSATPIPRTLAIIIYGDLDISVMDELPGNRLPIKNCVVGPEYRKRAYAFMLNEIREGRQVYVICPMVEESEGLDVENVLDYTAKLKEEFPPEVSVEYLHGKMKPKEKNSVMERFAAGEIQILVSTTVVEVGVNVPNATVMMVENAERFGLAQLHQLRGRVGRGKHQSYCIFVDGSDSEGENKRLKILNESNDGFYIASEDLKLRGPGDFFGVRQSGMMDFAIGDIFTDANILKDTAEAAKGLMAGEFAMSPEEKELFERKLENYQRASVDKLSL